jgi:hypothetical protein
MYPQVLVAMDRMQKRSSAQFKAIVSGYSQDVQKDIWNLARYPGLIARLCTGHTGTELKQLADTYPSGIRPTVMKYGNGYESVFQQITSLEKSTNASYDSLLSAGAKPVETAFRNIVDHPELISLLNKNMRMVVQLGELQKHNPSFLNQQFDSIGAVLAGQHARDVEAWKQGLENDPEAKQEFEESAKEFENENGGPTETVTEKVIVEYVYYPYPYWYSYPWWWEYPYWYPQPYWYSWGWYYGPYGLACWNYPSDYFMWWYFHHPHHHYHYSHFSNYCVNHYYGHHRSAATVNPHVQHWIKDNSENMPEGFMANDGKRPERIKELGKFETDFAEFKSQHTGTPISKKEFLKNNSADYPHLSPALTQQPQPRGPEKNNNTEWNPPKDNPPVQPRQTVPRQEPKAPTYPPKEKPPVYQPKQNPPPPKMKPRPPVTPQPKPKGKKG